MLLRRMVRMVLVLAAVCTVAMAGAVEDGARVAGAAESRPASARQLLFYNHAYGVLDRKTADAIEHSDYLRVFANFEVRSTTGADGRTRTGRYLCGRETYVELFGVGDLPGRDGTLGSTGMGISIEREGDLAAVLERLRDQGITDPVRFRQTRDFGDGVPVPWFEAVFTTDRYDFFGTWGMAYLPEYFADPRSNTEPPGFPGDVGRERYLSDDYQDHLMREVTYVRIAVSARDLANTVPLLRAGGFGVWPAPDGGVIAQGGGTTIQFDTGSHNRRGLRQIELSLNRPVAYRHEELIGRSTLVVGPGARAVWTFDTA